MYSQRTLEAILDQAEEAARAKLWHKSQQLCTELLQADPSLLRAWDLLGYVEYQRGEFDASLAACRKALEVDPEHPYALKGLGINLARHGEVEAAVDAFERCVALRPRWFDPYWDCAVALDQNDMTEAALQWIARGQQAIPEAKARFEVLASKLKTG